MPLSGYPLQGPMVGRRRESRLRVRMAARLITLDGTGRVVMADVSSWGARVAEEALRLRPGEEAVLQWNGREAFGVVVWAKAGQSGLCFYEPVPASELARLRQINDGQERDADRRETRRAAQSFVQGKIRL